MSGLIARVRQMFSKTSSDQVNRVADAVEKNVTDERVDQVMGRVPGSDRVREHVPENVGEKVADAMREHAGGEKPQE